MIAWIVITTSDLNAYLAGAQVSALRTGALASGQADPFLTIMPDVVAQVRAQIAACKTNKLSATANSVPPDLRSVTIYLILEAMQARVVGLKLTEEQKEILKEAKIYLKNVAECKIPVSDPTDPVVPSGMQNQADTIKIVGTVPTRLADRSKTSGL